MKEIGEGKNRCELLQKSKDKVDIVEKEVDNLEKELFNMANLLEEKEKAL